MKMPKKIFSFLKKKGIQFKKRIQFLLMDKKFKFQPVFIIGCGRSGTTILGKTLAKYPLICYLNERRDLWHVAHPEFDIWSKNSKERKLYATEKDAVPKKTKLLRKLFYQEQIISNKPILLEKLPINNFRLDFINFCFPEARFIYLKRSGLEVAKSIQKELPKNWFGNKNIKLKLLNEFGNTHTDFKVDNIEEYSGFQLGLYEWRLSVEQSNKFFKTLSPEKFIPISYTDFVVTPANTISKILDFLQLPHNDELLSDMCANIERKNAVLTVNDLDDELLNIGGPFLKDSIENKY